MAEPAPRPWTVEAFFAWQEGQAERYELVDGAPVRMMAGARNVHDDIVVNLIGELRERLRGGGCRPFTGDGSVQTGPNRIRRPDAGVDCGRRDPDGLTASDPRLVVEVLSPGNRDLDTALKINEYMGVASLTRILLVEPNAPEAVLWSRTAEGSWERETLRGLDGEVAVPELGITLPLARIYEGVEFPARPRLVLEGG
ncbi:MAG TPA: Uma2 family endonuclease [Beijerinckiaceae bacterium]|jgi:Uma2 family endonuclease